MAGDKYHGFSVSSDTDGTWTSYVYHGTRNEMEALAAEHSVGETGSDGWLRKIRVYQREGAVWECEFRYEAPEEWASISVPSRNWGASVSIFTRHSAVRAPLIPSCSAFLTVAVSMPSPVTTLFSNGLLKLTSNDKAPFFEAVRRTMTAWSASEAKTVRSYFTPF